MNNKIYIIIVILLLFFVINKYLLYNSDDDDNDDDNDDIEYFIPDSYKNMNPNMNLNMNPNMNQNIEIIIARYNEDLEWTLEEPFNQYKYTVYNKGDNDDFIKDNVKKIINLPNVGKCDHTYLYHIIYNYDNLSDIVVFLPGSIDLKYKKRVAKKLLKEIEKRNTAIFISLNETNIKKLYYNFKMDNYRTRHYSNIRKNSEKVLKKSSIRPFGLWFESIFGNLRIDCLIYYGIFSIHKDDIKQHPRSRYEMLIKGLSDHSNPEVGHYFERSWCAVFHPLKKTFVIKYNKI